MSRSSRYLVRIKELKQRYLIIIGLILIIICIGLFINLGIMLSNSPLKKINTTNETHMTYPEEINTINETYHVCSTISTNRSKSCFDYVFESSVSTNDHGFPLSNTIFMNYNLLVRGTGFITQVYLQLFKPWKGNSQLAIFVARYPKATLEILNRYYIIPHRSTTNWQTIHIPDNILPVRFGQFIGIGMDEYDENANEIYSVNMTFGIRGLNITRQTVDFSIAKDCNHSVAFRFMTYSPNTTIT